MKSLFASALLLVASFSTQGQTITSSFGFSITIPDTWTPLTKEEIKKNPDMFDFNKVTEMPADLLKQVKPMILEGKTELFFLPDNSMNFADNVNVIKQIGGVPTDSQSIIPLCKSLPAELSSYFQKQTKVYKCEVRTLGGNKSLYLEFDGLIANTRSLQYQIARSNNVRLVVTATLKDSSLAVSSNEFHKAMNTFKIK